MGKPGSRSVRGVGEIYDEPKSRVQVVALTSFAYDRLRAIALQRGKSISQLVEELIRAIDEGD